MMVSNKQIYKSARVVIDNCGHQHAEEYALSMMKVLNERGDVEGAFVWAKILGSVIASIEICYQDTEHQIK